MRTLTHPSNPMHDLAIEELNKKLFDESIEGAQLRPPGIEMKPLNDFLDGEGKVDTKKLFPFLTTVKKAWDS